MLHIWYNVYDMKAFFSKRHENALANEELRVSFNARCRFAIERVLQRHCDWGGWDDSENLTFDGATEDLITFYGEPTLKAFNAEGRFDKASISQVILKGLPAQVLDVVEAWFYQNPAKARECEKELNDIFVINNSSWRVVNGQAVLIDSEYLHREIQAKTIRLLEECEIQGALEEYQDAIDDLISGDTKDAIVNAHKSVESVMKAILETDEDYTYGKLLEMLIKSNVIPKYYDEFLVHFEKLALGVVKERNLPARGHGQGKKPTLVSLSLAEFAVNLAGAINIFIIKHWIETRQSKAKEEIIVDEDDIPF